MRLQDIRILIVSNPKLVNFFKESCISQVQVSIKKKVEISSRDWIFNILFYDILCFLAFLLPSTISFRTLNCIKNTEIKHWSKAKKGKQTTEAQEIFIMVCKVLVNSKVCTNIPHTHMNFWHLYINNGYWF